MIRYSYLAAGRHVNLVDTTENGSGQLGPEGIPDAVLQLARRPLVLHADALLSVHGIAQHHVPGDSVADP